eukprot:SAG11_NODE_16995_length_531_cov_1.425926_1_plen_171_part_10
MRQTSYSVSVRPLVRPYNGVVRSTVAIVPMSATAHVDDPVVDRGAATTGWVESEESNSTEASKAPEPLLATISQSTLTGVETAPMTGEKCDGEAAPMTWRPCCTDRDTFVGIPQASSRRQLRRRNFPLHLSPTLRPQFRAQDTSLSFALAVCICTDGLMDYDGMGGGGGGG